MNFFVSKKFFRKKNFKNFPILLIFFLPLGVEGWLMVFSGTTKSDLSEYGITESARLVFGARFAENMIFAYG